MAYEGMLINAIVTLFAGSCYLFVAAEVNRKRARAGARVRASVAFFLVVGVYLALAGLRQATAYAGTMRPSLAFLDPWLFHVVTVPAAFAIVPLGYLTTLAAWGNERWARGAAAFFATAATIGLAFLYAGGITGPTLTYWGSDWSINSLVAQAMLVLFLTLPALIASLLLVYTGSQMDVPRGRRLRLVGWSCLIYYVAFTLDAFGLEGWSLLAARLATAGAAVLGYVAYFHGPSEDADAAPGVPQ